MKAYWTALGIVALVWACGGNGTTSGDAASSPATAAADAPDGKAIYKQRCVVCHGLYGDMGASGAHDLTASILSQEERITVITKGRGVMMPFEPILKPEEIAAVAAYSMELKK
jgi:mono/diheme cytochrome c family protein